MKLTFKDKATLKKFKSSYKKLDLKKINHGANCPYCGKWKNSPFELSIHLAVHDFLPPKGR
jgi:glutaredoxin